MNFAERRLSGEQAIEWRRGPYYLDGLLPLAYMLDDGHLKAKACQLNQRRGEDGAADPLPQSPVDCDQPEDTITLVP
jgi:hypothetical protein